MIKLLAPTTVATADEGASVIIEVSQDVLKALTAAVQIAFEDEESIPEEFQSAAAEVWHFFEDGEETRT